ncbi:MAG: hypothetical protein EP343_28860 [Deltaproteobacteria bacterium]|nr:MAG: hypothetical protein EP343_28860 [Deltaproteobacteria bacterium]
MHSPKPPSLKPDFSASIPTSFPSHPPRTSGPRLAFFPHFSYGVLRKLFWIFERRISGLALLWFAFFLSGMAGLSYELTWVRYLTQLFGASTPAVAATVAIFFSGLALGAALGSKIFDRASRPMLAYARLELAIGVAAALVPFLFWVVEFSLAHYLNQGATNTFVLLIVSTFVLIVPTTLLGATFPAMAAVVRRLANPTYSTGFFYGFNTLGAVAGCLVVSFWLLPLWGQRYTTWAMALINLSIAIVFWVAHRAQAQTSDDTAAAEPDEPVASEEDGVEAQVGPAFQVSYRSALFLAATSGFLAIGIEVLWTRALALSFPASVYVFALVLAAYLVGIGLGSIWVGASYKTRSPHRQSLWLLYISVGLGSFLTLTLFPQLTPWSFWLLRNKWVSGWNVYLSWVGGSAVVAMLPATLVMGAAFPMLIGLATAQRGHASLVAGRLYAINTIGGVLGSLFVTFFLMPMIGLTKSLILLSLGYILLALVVCWEKVLKSWLRWSTLGTSAFLGLILLTGMHPSANPLRERPDHKVLFYKDAPSATIAVDQSKEGTRTLRVNNYYGLSNTTPSTVLMQYRLGHIPMLLHPKPKRALLVGFATGTTLAAIAQHGYTKVECVELHKDILNLAHYFSHVNHYIHRRKKQVRLIAEDGRRFLMRSGSKYDVVVGDLYLPRNPGVGVLYSVEHFRAVKRRLTKDGVFVAWLPLFQLGPRNMASIIRSFLQVFPNAEGWVAHWNPARAILGLIGRRSTKPLKVRSHFEARLNMWVGASFRTAKDPRHIWRPFFRPDQHGKSKPVKRRLLDAKMLTVWANSAPINRLELPVIEFSAPKAMMQARLHNFPLYLQNIRQIAEIRSLQGTPWGKMAPGLLKRKKPPHP